MTADRVPSPVERHVREIYANVPVPVDEIWQRVRTQPVGRARNARVARLVGELAVFSAVVLIITVAVLVPRLTRHSNGAQAVGGPSPPPAATSAATAPPSRRPNCSLPVAGVGTTSGFFDVRTGIFTPAPVAGESFARALGSWVSVPPQQVAPDGSAYAFVATSADANALYIQDTQGRHLVASSSRTIQILGFVSQGVVYSTQDGNGTVRTSLVSASAPVRLIDDGRTFMWAGGDALWRVAAAVEGPGIALYRFDLGTGRERIWLDVDQYLGPEAAASPAPMQGTEGVSQSAEDSLHHSLGIIGFDETGNPVVQLGSAGPQGLSATLLVTGPRDVIAIVPPGLNSAGHFVPVNAVGGASSVWMVNTHGDVAMHQDFGDDPDHRQDSGAGRQ